MDMGALYRILHTPGHLQGWAVPPEPGTCHEYVLESGTLACARCASPQGPTVCINRMVLNSPL